MTARRTCPNGESLSTAIGEDLLTKNAAGPVKLAPVRKRRGKAWTSEEARRFLESARDDEDPFYAAYMLILVLGLRRGEVLGLVWDDIDLDNAELTIGLQLQGLVQTDPRRAQETRRKPRRLRDEPDLGLQQLSSGEDRISKPLACRGSVPGLFSPTARPARG